MLRLHLILAWRNIIRRNVYAFIEIAGLAIGLACFLLVLIYVTKQFNSDTFFSDSRSIYRVLNLEHGSGNRYSGGASALGYHIREEIGEVEDVVRIFYPYKNYSTRGIIRYGDVSFYEDNIIEADSNFFSFFDFKFFSGDPKTAMDQPNSIMLSEKAAARLFPEGDALGKIIGLDEERALLITGVVQVPVNTHLTFDYIRPAHRDPEQLYVWEHTLAFTYLKVRHPEDIPAIQGKIYNIVLQHAAEEDAEYLKNYAHELQPISSISTTVLQWDIISAMPASQLWGIFVIAVFVLLLAIINFVNLATARVTERLKEVGINKVLGASRHKLILQFYLEFLLVTLFAGISAIVLMLLVIEPFNLLVNTALNWKDLLSIDFLLTASLVVLFTSIVAGWYPAYRLSGFRVSQSLSKVLTSTVGERRLREALVLLQFVISITLVTGTLIVNRQISFMREADLGFNQENVYVLRIPESARADIRELKNVLLSQPQVDKVAGASALLGGEPGSDTFHPDHMPEQTPDTFAKNIAVDTAFLDLMGVRILAGRNFQSYNSADHRTAYIINEAAVRQFELKEPIHANFHRSGDTTGRIIGVMKDFHFSKMSEKINPMVFFLDSLQASRYLFLSVRGSATTAVREIEKVWSTSMAGYPIEGFFQDQYFNSLYKREQQVATIAKIFAVTAMLLASMGLFGMASFTIMKREKEIGIRKIVGATVPSIILLLSRSFLKLILFALAVSIPLTIFLANEWLENFIVRIAVQPLHFFIAAALTLLMACLTVGYQALQAAIRNPVKALKQD